ncbi:MAG TPA: hypothetical protein VEH48_00315 [Candidatus Nitrosopolaris sp.]|nr:hypothetical protein [Candidatus Nitrosopolaris sp.]
MPAEIYCYDAATDHIFAVGNIESDGQCRVGVIAGKPESMAVICSEQDDYTNVVLVTTDELLGKNTGSFSEASPKDRAARSRVVAQIAMNESRKFIFSNGYGQRVVLVRHGPRQNRELN